MAQVGSALLGAAIRAVIGLRHWLRRTRREVDDDGAIDEPFPIIPPIANGNAPLAPATEAKSMLVSDLMTRNPAPVRGEQDLALAAQLMWDRDCGALPVIDDNREVVGVITDRDICMATWSQGQAPGCILVAAVMSKNVISCRPEDSIWRAESIMRANQLRRLPVIGGDDELIGMLSLADIARAADGAPKLRADSDISGERLAATLARICTTPSRSAPGPRAGAGL
jgi:CBS domain-containing protein